MRSLKFLRLLATLALVLGVLLHIVVADTWGMSRVPFYAMPLPVLTAGWLMAAIAWGWRRVSGVLCFMFAVACGLWWFAVSYRFHEAPQGQVATLKVISWNMAHRKLPSADLQTLLETYKPDIAGLVEVGSRHSDPSTIVTTLPPGYTAQKLDHAMAIVVRGSVRVVHQVLLGKISKFALLEATVDGVTWRVFIVDGTSGPTRSRADVLARVLSEARAHPRTVITGDFNTPIESALLDPWRADLHHAFNDAGHGFRETWPRPLPVLTIDHVWSSPDSPPLHAEKRWLPSSDHAVLLVELGKK